MSWCWLQGSFTGVTRVAFNAKKNFYNILNHHIRQNHMFCSASCHAYPSHKAHRDLRRGCTAEGPPPAFCWLPNRRAPVQAEHRFPSPPGAGLSSPSCQRQDVSSWFSLSENIYTCPCENEVQWAPKDTCSFPNRWCRLPQSISSTLKLNIRGENINLVQMSKASMYLF